MSSNWGCILSRQIVLHTMQCRPASIRLHLGPQTLPTPLRRGTPRFSVFEMVPRNVGSWHIPEEAVSTGKVRSLGMTGLVENVPLPPSLTHSGHCHPSTARHGGGIF